MSFYDGVLLNTILLLFPICIYLLYVAYNNNINKKKNKLFFDFICLTSIYLLIKYRVYFSDLVFILLINVPLILSYIKKRTYLSIIISIIIIIYYVSIYNFSITYITIEYLLYFLLYYFYCIKNKKFNTLVYNFIFIKGIVLSIEIFYLLPTNLSLQIIIFRVFLILLLFYIITSLVLSLLKKGEEILSLNNVLKELEKEKALRSSLFKITHEIKNPLAVCKGYLDMMDYSDLDNAYKYNAIIKSEIERTLSLMDDFLDYTKIKVNLDIMDITMLINDTILSIKPLLAKKNIILKETIIDDDIIIDGDYNRLKQVLINLIKNSVEAITLNGIIEILLKQTKTKVMITISDNGCGMSCEELIKLGETFYTTKTKGTGLGVTLSKEIIKLHNGSIKYISKVDKGTKVTITLHKYKNI